MLKAARSVGISIICAHAADVRRSEPERGYAQRRRRREGVCTVVHGLSIVRLQDHDSAGGKHEHHTGLVVVDVSRTMCPPDHTIIA
jgi:hypothetical protein